MLHILEKQMWATYQPGDIEIKKKVQKLKQLSLDH